MRLSDYLVIMFRKAVGHVKSATGSVTVARLGGFIFQPNDGDSLHQGDVIETGPESAVGIAFNDGTVFNLSADARLALNEFICDPDGTANSAQLILNRGTFAFSAGRLAKTGGLRIDTPVGSIQGRARGVGIGSVSLAVLAFTLLQDLQSAHALTTDDDAITPKDSDYGTFEIVTRAGTVVQVDDPGLTYSVDQDGSVERQTNSSSRMEELQSAQQAALGTFARGFAGPGGSGSPLEFQGVPGAQPLIIPINFRPLDPIPERIEPVFPAPVEVTPQLPGPPPERPPQPPVIRAFTLDSGIDGDRITNNNVLVLTGTATPGSIVTIFDSGMLIGSTTADESGAWSLNTGTLSDGEHAFTAAAAITTVPTTTRAVTTAETRAVSTAYIVTIDTQSPSAPGITGFEADSGSNDHITNDTTPTLTIAAEADSTVQVFRDGVLIGNATETATAGIFTFTSEILGDNIYNFAATATDAAGNTSAKSDGFTIKINSVAPSAPVIIAFADNSGSAADNLTDDTTPTLKIAAEAGSTVQVYRDGVWAGTATETGTAGIFTFTSETLAENIYTFTATATDAADNTSPSSTAFTVGIDNAPPLAPVITAFADNSGSAADQLTDDATPTLTITAEAGSTVWVYKNGTPVGTATETVAPGIFTFTSAALADGSYSFTATSTDAADNTGPSSTEFTVGIDNTPPSKPLIAAFTDNTGSLSDNLTDDTTPTLKIIAEAGSIVQVYRDGVAVGAATETATAGIFTFTSAELADGNYSFTVTATDAANNTSQVSLGFAIAIATADPNDFDHLATGDFIVIDPNGTVHGTPRADTITAQEGGGNTGQKIYGGAGNDDIKGTGLNDIIYGGSGDDRINGNNGADKIFGGSGSDTISGSNENDIIIGGFGADDLTGSNGEDAFIFLSVNDSRPGQYDVLSDFRTGSDKIDLSAIDADTNQLQDQAFNFVDAQTDTIVANSITYYYDLQSNQTHLLADTDGDIAIAELEIAFAGRVTLTQNDFIL